MTKLVKKFQNAGRLTKMSKDGNPEYGLKPVVISYESPEKEIFRLYGKQIRTIDPTITEDKLKTQHNDLMRAMKYNVDTPQDIEALFNQYPAAAFIYTRKYGAKNPNRFKKAAQEMYNYYYNKDKGYNNRNFTNDANRKQNKEFTEEARKDTRQKEQKVYSDIALRNDPFSRNMLKVATVAAGLPAIPTMIGPAFGSWSGLGSSLYNATGAKTAAGAALRTLLPSTWTTAAGLSPTVGGLADAGMLAHAAYMGGSNLANKNNWQSGGRYANGRLGGLESAVNLGLDATSVLPIIAGGKEFTRLANEEVVPRVSKFVQNNIVPGINYVMGRTPELQLSGINGRNLNLRMTPEPTTGGFRTMNSWGKGSKSKPKPESSAPADTPAPENRTLVTTYDSRWPWRRYETEYTFGENQEVEPFRLDDGIPNETKFPLGSKASDSPFEGHFVEFADGTKSYIPKSDYNFVEGVEARSPSPAVLNADITANHVNIPRGSKITEMVEDGDNVLATIETNMGSQTVTIPKSQVTPEVTEIIGKPATINGKEFNTSTPYKGSQRTLTFPSGTKNYFYENPNNGRYFNVDNKELLNPVFEPKAVPVGTEVPKGTKVQQLINGEIYPLDPKLYNKWGRQINEFGTPVNEFGAPVWPWIKNHKALTATVGLMGIPNLAPIVWHTAGGLFGIGSSSPAEGFVKGLSKAPTVKHIKQLVNKNNTPTTNNSSTENTDNGSTSTTDTTTTTLPVIDTAVQNQQANELFKEFGY